MSVVDTLDGEILFADGIGNNHFNIRQFEDSKLKIALLPHQRNKNIKSLGENVLVLTIHVKETLLFKRQINVLGTGQKANNI